MAGAGYKLFNTGDVLTAAQVNTYLNEQTVMVFASSAARTSALSGVLAEGMVSYLQDTNAVEVYNGTSWVNVGNAGDITEVQAGTGISVASGTGPIPVVTNTVATAFDAAGDLVYGTGADTFTKLSIGTANQVLTVNSGATAPEWKTPSAATPTYVGCSLADNTSQTLANNTFTAFTFNTEITDSDGFHSTVTNTSRITIPTGKGGKYLIYGVIGTIQSNATGLRFLRLYVNGAFADPQQRLTVDTEGRVSLTLTEIRSLSAADYIELFGMQDSGGNLNFENLYFGATLLGA